MTIYITQGRYTGAAMRGMLAKPEDRSTTVRALIEAAGGQMLNYFVTFGEYDFLVISEAPDEKAVAKVLLAAAGAGGVESLRTVPAMTAAEAKTAFAEASELSKSFKPAGA